MWFYFYVYMPVSGFAMLQQVLPDWELALGELVALLCLLGLLFGWYQGRRTFRNQRRSNVAVQYDVTQLWWAGLGLILLGAIQANMFYRQENVNWSEESGYWYLLFHVQYIGFGLCFLVLTKSRHYRTLKNIVLLAVLMFVAMFPHIAAARRGPMYPMVIVLLYTPMLVSGRPRPLLVLSALGAAGMAMLFLVMARQWLSNPLQDNGWKAAWESLSIQSITEERAGRLADNEFAYHCALVATVYDRGLYQYGTGYLMLAVNAIPRQWWADKPARGSGLFSPAGDQVRAQVGWAIEHGGAVTGAGSSFEQFGFSAIIFWFFIGRTMAWVYSRACTNADARWQLWWIGLLCTVHWVVSQSFSGAFVPGCIYFATTTVVFWAATKTKRRPLPYRSISGRPNHTNYIADPDKQYTGQAVTKSHG